MWGWTFCRYITPTNAKQNYNWLFEERELAVRSLQATLGFDFKLREEFIRKFLLRY